MIGTSNRLAATLALGLTLAACNTGPVNRSVETIKAPALATQQIAYDVDFGAGEVLGTAQARALEQYLGTIGLAYGDRVSIDDPTGSPGRRAAISAVVAKFGLLVDDSGPVAGGTVAPGRARVVIARTSVTMPDCPDWRRKSNPEPEMSAMSNFGCATRGNLAAMIADPTDLVTGKPYDGADGLTTSKAIGAFRSKAPTGSGELKAESPGGGGK